MKVCVVGATGLLGYQGAKELIKRGHRVVGITLPPVPEGLEIPNRLDLKLGNYLKMSDSALKSILSGCDAL